ncbi:hypothetical protein NC796_24755 [Aliifodinibius sp. S!AR15-10]|uniref:hypothetical protein n=1 Tax=Aliifodinibius sp. S!AR15-10 TaxID=2950437 RepID=UPI0028585483|nr:hypothetical protein [Aliifodinibius sp. S!AR15-10]MDR8394382.1 hypothetical protein [Aliifodinibius sp. S!AR15-10]
MEFIKNPDEEDKFIVVRTLTTRSSLQNSHVKGENASLFVTDDICFTVARVRSRERYYELQWSFPEEIAFFSSLILGVHPDYGKIFIFPVRWPFYLEDTGQDLSKEEFLIKVAGKIKAEISSSLETSNYLNNREFLPAKFIDASYKYGNVGLSKDYRRFLFDKIDTENDLLIRGLSHLIKCGMLRQFGRMFFDTASLELYISLEATLHIIQERLRQNGMQNPSNKDVSDYLLEKFGEPYRLDRYYEEFYDDRIKAVHPDSRFGKAMFVPHYVTDLYMLYNDLMRNYEFLITGKPKCYQEFEFSESL